MVDRTLRLVISLACLLVGAAASAEQDDCVFFPHIRCPEREGSVRYPGFIPPSSMPYLFEDPFITTDVFAHFIWHEFDEDSVMVGGDAYVAAVQARLAITDRLALIATKDGYVWMRPDSDSLIPPDDGFFDITVGLKYALIDRPEDRFILTPALRFDIPVGHNGLFSGNGDGVVIPSVSSAYGIGPVNLIGSAGFRLPFSMNKESGSFFYNLHLSYPVLDFLVPFLELNGTTWISSANGNRVVDTKVGPVDLTTAQDVVHNPPFQHTSDLRFEGADVVNLGSRGVTGNTVMTLAVGARVPITKHVSMGAYYEFPITSRRDIFGQRVDVNAEYAF